MRRLGLAGAATIAVTATLALLLGGSGRERPEPDRELSGGEGTVFDTSREAFSVPLRTLPTRDRRAFAVGNSLFNRNWVTAPASTSGQDGLGPTFNAQSCSSCHFKDGRAQPPSDGDRIPELGLLLRLSIDDATGAPEPVRAYGGQLQDRAINGVPAEGTIRIRRRAVRGRFRDGTPYTLLAPSYAVAEPAFGPLPRGAVIGPRIAPPVFGVGLLEAVPEEVVVDAADPSDDDGDGISGRPNRVIAVGTGRRALGRFGWKANVPTVKEQNASAFQGDIGLTNPVFDAENCPDGQGACAAAPDGGRPELDARKLDRVTFYTRVLAPPARRQVGAAATDRGERDFAEIGCAACHLPELETGPADVAGLRDQAIRPYTDLLLHDMGPGLADGRPDGLASGSEWRTAPLWGIGLTETVSRHARFLHDGRARGLEEAILWHGGEAQAARDRFRALDRRARADLLAFLRSL